MDYSFESLDVVLKFIGIDLGYSFNHYRYTGLSFYQLNTR